MDLARQSLSAEERRLYARAHQSLNQGGLLRGSLVVMRRRCGKPTCRCRGSRRKWHRSMVLKIGANGKQRTLYVPPGWEDRVRTWVARYAEIRGVLEQLCLSCLRRLQRGEP